MPIFWGSGRVQKTSNNPKVSCVAFCLGAGKSTTVNLLTGMKTPTSGEAWINNCSIQNDLSSVRKMIGFCPQHDLLFDRLTVNEHLTFYAKLRGIQNPQASIDSLLERVTTLLEVS